MKRILLVALMFAASIAIAQTPPSVEQCRADRNEWMRQRMEDDSPSQPSTSTLASQILEMDQCRLSIDQNAAVTYRMAEGLIVMTMSTRQAHFLQRHGLLERFYAEDERGER